MASSGAGPILVMGARALYFKPAGKYVATGGLVSFSTVVASAGRPAISRHLRGLREQTT